MAGKRPKTEFQDSHKIMMLTFYQEKLYFAHGYKSSRTATIWVSSSDRQRAAFGLAKSPKRMGTTQMERPPGTKKMRGEWERKLPFTS